MSSVRRPGRVRRLLAAAALLGAAGAGAAGAGLLGGAGPGLPRVVAVQVRPASGPAELATGVVLGPGRVLTVAHVLRAGGRVAVRGADGIARSASVVRADPGLDLAVLGVRGLDGSTPEVADGDAPARILVLRGGRARERPATVRRRIAARLVDQERRPRRPSLELGADVRGGDSGAPVVDEDGRIIGIVYARSSRRAGTAYAVRGPGLRRLAAEGR